MIISTYLYNNKQIVCKKTSVFTPISFWTKELRVCYDAMRQNLQTLKIMMSTTFAFKKELHFTLYLLILHQSNFWKIFEVWLQFYVDVTGASGCLVFIWWFACIYVCCFKIVFPKGNEKKTNVFLKNQSLYLNGIWKQMKRSITSTASTQHSDIYFWLHLQDNFLHI